MTNSKITKRALFSSVVALLLCFTMLLGTTFAWFTDSASSAVNTIQAGTLDIVLEKNTNGSWGNAEGQTIAFRPKQGDSAGILWEPGCTFLTEGIRLVNNGNLALKFDLVVSGGTTTDKDGNTSAVNLLDALEITYEIFDTDGGGNAGAAVTESNGTVKGNLTAGQKSNMFFIRVHMKEDAGDEYQGLKLDGLTVAVSAQQLNHEYDSFGNYYDEQIEALAGGYILDNGNGARVAVEVLNLKGITGPDSFYINILDANGNVMNTIKPAQKTIDALTTDGVFKGATACAYLTYTGDDWWVIDPWGELDANNPPVKAVLYVNDVEKGNCNITANGTTWADVVNNANN